MSASLDETPGEAACASTGASRATLGSRASRAINPMLVEGQIHGGVQIGIGYALFEDVANDPRTGRMGGNSFARYILANSLEMPPVAVRLIEAGEPTGPFGAKAVGEIATIPVAAAVVNAVNHALGTALPHLPLVPARVLAALDAMPQAPVALCVGPGAQGQITTT